MSKLTNAVGCKFGGPEEREKGLKEAFKVCMEASTIFGLRHTQSMGVKFTLCMTLVTSYTNRSLTKMVPEH